jgi:hypothetical protein
MNHKPATETEQQRIEQAYLGMVKHARYRPAAPSDGLGSIDADYDLEDPHNLSFIQEADSLKYFIGCPAWNTNRALVYAVEASRLLCAKVPYYKNQTDQIALRLFQMAIEEVQGERK